MTRVAVFIDYQNVYMGARDAFDWRSNHFSDGQVFPRRLALRLVERRREQDPARELVAVHAFRGEPSAEHSPGGQAACQRQVQYWNAQALVTAVTRPLKYYRRGTNPDGTPHYEPREKGIDVLLALAMVMGARDDDYDVAVLCTRDTDLIPALEAVMDLGKRCEVATWKSPRTNSRLWVPGRSVWCHYLNRKEFDRVADDTDYTRPVPGGIATAAD